MKVISSNLIFLLFTVTFTGAQRTRPNRRTTTPTPTTTAEPTTTFAEEDDEYMLAAKALIDAGTCRRVTSSSVCGGDPETSYFKDFFYNGNRVVIANGIPDHEAEHDQLVDGPNTRCERWQFMVLPINPGKGSISATGLGSIGLATTAGQFFNHLSNPDGSLALANEGRTLDSCFGHSAGAGQYHYHANINCTNAGSASGANDPDQCIHVGYYIDGVPVYGLCKDSNGNQMSACYSLVDGSATSDVTVADGNTYTVAGNEVDYQFDSSVEGCNLDEANGAIHPITGEYSYFFTTGYPWIPIYYFGDSGTSSLCSLGL